MPIPGGPLKSFVTQAKGSAFRVEGDASACIEKNRALAVTHTTVSYLPECIDQLREIAQAGVAVVSSAEELLYSWLRHPKWAYELDELC